MKTHLFSFGGIGYRVLRNSTYFDIYPFTRPVPRAFNQPTIAVGSEQRNVFKKHSIARSTVHSHDRPFARRGHRMLWWPPQKFSREVKISVVMCIRTDMSAARNYSISRKVSSDTFISRSLKGLSYGRLYGTTTPRIPKREVKIMRGTALWTARLLGPDGKELVCVTRVTIRIYETCGIGKGAWANYIIFTSIASLSRWFLYRNSHYLHSFDETAVCLKESKESNSKQVFSSQHSFLSLG